ncbi:MAG: YbgA family protein [Halioglobus sp.]
MEDSKPKIGIGACLVGSKVRYNGESKRKNPHIESLKEHTDVVPFCPEVGIGMGVPRETVRLVGELGQERIMDSATQTIDYTDPMRNFAARVVSSNQNLAGYILVKGSPSCGLARVKRYNAKGNVVLNDAEGVFTQALRKLDPLLPLEDDGRLHDPVLRENFATRVYTYHDWKTFRLQPLSHHGLVQFWARYKYLLMSHDVPAYKEIGRLLANAKTRPIEKTAALFIHGLMSGLGKTATRKSHANVLQHIRGYLKRDLEKPEKQEMDSLIMQYSSGQIPLVVPLTLLRHHFRRHQSDYIARQVYMQPYPEQLSLRNLI